MKILVLIKEVPVVNDIKIDRETLTVDRSGAGKMSDPAGLSAVNCAVAFAKAAGAPLTAMSMGPDSCEGILRDAAAYGAGELVRITDDAYAGADSLVTARVLKAAIDRAGGYDIIFCGASSIDGATGQIGPKLAAMLGAGILSHVSSASLTEEGVEAERKTGKGYETLSGKIPVVISVTTDAGRPAAPSLKGKTAAKKAVVTVLDNSILGLSEEELASRSKVVSLYPPKAEAKGAVLEAADGAEAGVKLVDLLTEKHYI
ncbi:MAG: electron transfer flavoprotein subunit beta/FixA family protein [Lachnospiraceae bacterium]|nr:electron transfer flavoprotein subunit beta/FixA family protein [Lachnospiraceae bacterium]